MDVDLNSLRSLVTVLSFIGFMAIVVTVYARRNRHQYDDAAQLPFLEDGDSDLSAAAARNLTNGGHRE
ncbi:MAG: cbb3-type cytochrome oxidase subunit 3 [Leptothrix sp. (in: b-proteobacteria)]